MTDPTAGFSDLSPLELAVGAPLGAASAAPEPALAPGRSLPEALADALVPALARPPALVAFSGGRDSSLLLAAAVDAARRHGLPAPIAVTYRNAAAPAAEESRWQELVLAHLGVDDWVRIDGGEELDFLGPVAESARARHGVLYPPNGHFVARVSEPARGGTLILGIGGDELLGSWRWTRRADQLARRARPSLGGLGTLALGSAPAAVRARLLRNRRTEPEVPWLTPAASRRLREVAFDEELQPPRWDHYVLGVTGRRLLAMTIATLTTHAHDQGAELSLPLLAPRFRATLAAVGGRHGWADRSALTAAIAGGRLPEELTGRPTKAVFHEVYWGARSRRLAREWDGRSPAAELVDGERLRRAWLAPVPDYRSALLPPASITAPKSDKTAS